MWRALRLTGTRRRSTARGSKLRLSRRLARQPQRSQQGIDGLAREAGPWHFGGEQPLKAVEQRGARLEQTTGERHRHGFASRETALQTAGEPDELAGRGVDRALR